MLIKVDLSTEKDADKVFAMINSFLESGEIIDIVVIKKNKSVLMKTI